MITPYYQDEAITLYCGDAMELLAGLPGLRADAIVTDPPYGETSLQWDRWPAGWPLLASRFAPQLWCFGSMRMFFSMAPEFAEWKFSQDLVWHKHNGSSAAADRFRRVHEHALHFYTGEWASLYKDPQMTNDAVERAVRRKFKPTHWSQTEASAYESHDGGPRLQRSVIDARSCHGYATNETQKPEDIVAPLIGYSVPAGGHVLDLFAGSGTTLIVAKKSGRRATGIELRESQCLDIVNRLSQSELPIGGYP